MKLNTIIFTAITLLSLGVCAQDLTSALTLNKSDLIFKTELLTPYIMLGDSIPLRVSLKSNKNIAVFDLETAWMYFQLKKFENGRYTTRDDQGWSRTTGGTYRYHVGNSGMHQRLQLKQNKILLNPEDARFKNIELNDLMGEFTYPGKYMFCITYEWQIKDSILFEVNLSYDKTIPRLLDYMEYSNTKHGRISPLKVFMYLTGHTPGNKIILPEEEPMLVPQLRSWWKTNKDLVLKVETTLNRKEYKDLNYAKRIAAIIKAMQSDDYEKRLAATKELQNITTMVLISPGSSDSPETIEKNRQMVIQWWDKNKELIEWISRVIIDNRIA